MNLNSYHLSFNYSIGDVEYIVVTIYKSLFRLIKFILWWVFMEINRRCLKTYFMKADLERRALRYAHLSILLCIQGCQHDVWTSAFAIILNVVIKSLQEIVLQFLHFLMYPSFYLANVLEVWFFWEIYLLFIIKWKEMGSAGRLA